MKDSIHFLARLGLFETAMVKYPKMVNQTTLELFAEAVIIYNLRYR